MDRYLDEILRRNTKRKVLGQSVDISIGAHFVGSQSRKTLTTQDNYKSLSSYTIPNHKDFIKKNIDALRRNYKLDELK